MKTPTQVLLVEDRDVVRETMRGILSDFDCVFEEQGTGSGALERMSQHRFDVVFLDLKLPDVAGIEVLREVRRRGDEQGPIIILTGIPDQETSAEAERLEVFRYLSKTPMNRAELREAFITAVPSARRIPRKAPDVGVGKAQLLRPRARARTTKLPRLLVLDDNEKWLDVMRTVLGEEYDLTLTTSAKEAVRRVRRQSFALVILDMKLPHGTSGLDVLTQMRKSAPDLRAIILTDYPDRSTEDASRRIGALDYVKKHRSSLASTVSDVLARGARPTRVFLCYCRRDREEVVKYYSRLVRRGFLPWMDCMSIITGKKWAPEIQRAIKNVDRFVYFLSRHSAQRKGPMRSELRQALRRQDELLDDSVFLIPARLEECEVEESLSEFHYVDLFEPGGFTKLLAGLVAE